MRHSQQQARVESRRRYGSSTTCSSMPSEGRKGQHGRVRVKVLVVEVRTVSRAPMEGRRSRHPPTPATSAGFLSARDRTARDHSTAIHPCWTHSNACTASSISRIHRRCTCSAAATKRPHSTVHTSCTTESLNPTAPAMHLTHWQRHRRRRTARSRAGVSGSTWRRC